MHLVTLWESLIPPSSCSASPHSLQLDPTETLWIHNIIWQGVGHVPPERSLRATAHSLGFQFLPHPPFPSQRGCREIPVAGSQAVQVCLHCCLMSCELLLSHRHQAGKNSSPPQEHVGETSEILYRKVTNTRNVFLLWKQSRLYLRRFLHDS